MSDLTGIGHRPEADLQTLAETALECLGSGCERTKLRGPPVAVPATLVLMLGVALRELAINAVRYGALSVEEGWVALAWTIQSGDDGVRTVEITWRELDGPLVETPRRAGFGTRWLQHGLGGQLGTTVTLDFAPCGFECRIWMVLEPEALERGRLDELDGHGRRARGMTRAQRNVLWYDRLQADLQACRNDAVRAGDLVRANRALLLWLWANDRAELLSERID